MEEYYRDTYIEIDENRLLKNINTIKDECSPDKFLYLVIKGNGYGHGIVQTAQLALESKADGVAVATLDEAIIVRKYCPEVKILCLGNIPTRNLIDACNNNITITIGNKDLIKALQEINLPKELLVQIKVNSGMNRIGFNSLSEIKEILNNLLVIDNVKIDGIFTHFATAEGSNQLDYFQQQFTIFKDIVENIDYEFNQVHCSNSASLLKFHQDFTFTNTSRVGIAAYGGLQDPIQDKYDIKSAFSLKAIITQVQSYHEGTGVGYCLRYHTQKDNEIIATIALGYADGFPRLLTNSKVKCNNQYGTIVGSICMDQLMIKFDKPVSIGETVTLIDNDPELSVYKRAEQAQTITHEIFTNFTSRVPRLYYRDNKLKMICNDLINLKGCQ